MLNSFQAVMPDHTIAAVRRLGRFFVTAGTLQVARAAVGVANPAGDTVIDVRVNGATIYADPVDRLTIEADSRVGLQDNLSTVVLDGDIVEMFLTAWPTGGLVGPAAVEISVDDGEAGSGGSDTDATLDPATLIESYFDAVLDRPPDGTEASAHLAALEGACIGITFAAEVAARIEALFVSGEYVALATTDEEFVDDIYWAYFGHGPDATGLAFWLNELDVGGANRSRADVRSDFATHREFINRLTLYCRNQLPQAEAVMIGDKAPGEFVRDEVAAALTGSADITVTPNDPGDVIALALTNTGAPAGEYGAGTSKVHLTIDAKGRILDIEDIPAVVGGGAVDVQIFDTPGADTWEKPAGATMVYVVCIGAGGGGGGAAGGVAGVARTCGAGGGGGARNERLFRAASLGATEDVVVGAAGAAGVGNVSPTVGTLGGNGGASSFAGTKVFAGGGGGGRLGAYNTVAVLPGAGGGHSSSAALEVAGGPVGWDVFPGGNGGYNALGGMGATGNASSSSGDGRQGHSEWGGAGGGGLASTSTNLTPGNSLWAGSGGGCGGAISAANAQIAGTAGGSTGPAGATGGGVGGAVGGGNGGAGTAHGGGGGGGANNAGQGGDGGAGATPGGGGGGGGAGTSPARGGHGGVGGRGEVRVYSW